MRYLGPAVLLVMISCGPGDVEGDQVQQAPEPDQERQQSAEGLWDRTFVSVTVTEGDEPRQLVPDTRIEVTFEERENQGVVRWAAGCNAFGGEVEITADRLLLGEVGGTEMGCRDQFQEQDEWLLGFFDSDPHWRLSDDRLTLTSGETVIELEANGD
jgi:heat shock protein HslJ